MRVAGHPILIALGGTAWAVLVGVGLFRTWAYAGTPSVTARPPVRWPVDTSLPAPRPLPTLVLLIHPKCPCSRATIGELARLMADCRGRLTATVVMLRPAGASDGWERTDLWEAASAVPGVVVVSDAAGAEARRFGAATSGQALLYDAFGRLAFSGGMTASRGHHGDNAGRSAVTALVLDGQLVAAGPARTPVFGCPLFNRAAACRAEGSPSCASK